MSGRLAGKQAIVTGAARGIGAAIARAFAREGAALAINDIDATGIDALALELREGGAHVVAIAGDISIEDDVRRLVNAAVDALGGLNVLVNNAGIGGTGRTIGETQLEEWERFLRVNLTGTFLCCREALPHLRVAGGGSIVNLSSITALTGAAGSVPYGAAKAGVLGLTKSLAREVAKDAIRVNAIAPGLIDTEMSRARGQEESRRAVLWPRIGVPEDVAHLAVFLAADESEYITGQVIGANGGALM